MPRDPRFIALLGIGAAATAACCAGAWLQAGPAAASWVLACGAALLVLFAVTTALRYRRIAQLSERLDRALSGERDVSGVRSWCEMSARASASACFSASSSSFATTSRVTVLSS